MSTGLRAGHLVLLVRICWGSTHILAWLAELGCIPVLSAVLGRIGLNSSAESLELGPGPVAVRTALDSRSRATHEALVKVEVVLAQKPVREDLARKVEVPDVAP